MTETIVQLEPLNLDSMSAQVAADGVVRIKGVISMRAPTDTLEPFLRRVHEAALADGLETIVVDLTELSFMNSSSIRVLITWLDWIAELPERSRYSLHFRTNPAATWQRTSLSVLQALAEGGIEVSSGPV